MKFLIEVDISSCSDCPFLNSSDTGEDCRILNSNIYEDEWSNIDYGGLTGYDEMYIGCPLIYKNNLTIKPLVKVLK